MSVFVSIIIPTYNRADLIVKTIETVIKQTYHNFEIIVVDDGSTDNTEDVISKINDNRIRYIYQKNAGPSAARNNGIRNVRGEWIAFLDSDDLWMPEKLERQVKAITENPDVGIISCWFINVLSDGTESCPETRPIINEEYVKAILLFPDYISSLPNTSAMLVKKQCFEEIGLFDETMISKEDCEIWCKIAINYGFYCINEILYYYKRQEDNLSKITDINKVLYGDIRFLDSIFENKNLPQEFYNYKPISYSNTYLMIGTRALYSAKNRDIARDCLLLSIKNCPQKIFRAGLIISLFLTFMPLTISSYYFSFKDIIKAKIFKK